MIKAKIETFIIYVGFHARRYLKFEKYAALPLRMSPFPCCIFDNIETVNVTKSRFPTLVSRYKRNAVNIHWFDM